MNITITNSEDEEIVLPAKYEVCYKCLGKGTHVNESIDGNGITSSEWDEICSEDDSFAEDYMSGIYDVSCTVCHGLRVELIVNEELLSTEQKEQYEEHCEYQTYCARMDAEDRRYQRMESGDY